MPQTILLSVNPKDTARLRLDEEVREIDAGLQRAQRRSEFTLKQQWAARVVLNACYSESQARGAVSSFSSNGRFANDAYFRA